MNLFQLVPEEIIRLMFQYMDIPSISALSQTSRHKSGSISFLASDDETWFDIVQERFNISSIKSAGSLAHRLKLKPKHYGGSNWKESYYTLHSSNRMPKVRSSWNKKAIFAKGGGFHCKKENSSLCADAKGIHAHATHSSNAVKHNKINSDVTKQRYQGATKSKFGSQFVAFWVTLGHTDNCRLRSSPRSNNGAEDEIQIRRSMTYVARNNPFIELHLCFQNTKSGCCNVDIDVSNTLVRMIGAGNIRIIQKGDLKPRIIHRLIRGRVSSTQFQRGHKSCPSSLDNLPFSAKNVKKIQSHLPPTFVEESEDEMSLYKNNPQILTLKPFEFAVVAVNVLLGRFLQRGEAMQYETDFLTRAHSICVPIQCNYSNIVCTPKLVESVPSQENDELFYHEESSDALSFAPATSVATATFISEKVVWDHYCELPGGCLTLTDRSQLIPV